MKGALALLLLASAAHAATYPPRYRWQTITTEHFYVHYHQGEEDLAARAAAIAEDAHRRVVPLFGWEPDRRTHLVLTDHVDVANGWATPFPNNRIEVYVSAPGADPTSSIEYYDNWLNLVITHEYAHILHLDQARGFPAVLRRILGRYPLAFPNIWSPLWMIEGVATLVESETTEAGRLKGSFVDMVLRTAAVENRWPSEAQASGLTPYWPGGSARYFFGSKFLEWLAEKYGREKLTEYFINYSSNIVPFRVNASAEEVFGPSLKELYDQWSREQQRDYLDERTRLGALSAVTKLTSLGYETKYPAVSPDGRRIAYAHRGPFERPTLRVRDAGGGRDVATLPVNTISALSWSPSGETVAFSQLEFHRSYAIVSDLYLWNVRDGGVRRVTRNARLKDPAFTPDGRSLIAVQNRFGRNALVEVDLAGGAIRPLVTPDDYTQFSEPAINSDGSRIAVAEWHHGRIDIVVYSRDGRRMANMTGEFPSSVNASPHFAGPAILFSSDVTGIPNLYSVTAGGTPSRLTNVYGGAFYPASTGDRLYFSNYSSEGFDLAEIRGSGLGIRDSQSRSRISNPESRIPNPEPRTPRPYSPWSSLTPRWWFPIIASSVTENDEVEISVGGLTSGADALGFHSYQAQAVITARENDTTGLFSLLYAYDRLYPTLTVGAFRYEDDVSTSYTETTTRFLAQVSAPWRKFQWQTYGWAGVIRDDVEGDPPPGLEIFRGVLQGFRAGALFNNARVYGFSISPENGVTLRIDYENLSRALGSDRSLQQVRGDLRGYVAIPYRRSPLGRHVLAARLAGGQNTGETVFQREIEVGGTGAGEFIGLDMSVFPVRGYSRGVLRGDKAGIASVEYRVPIYEINRGPSTYPIFFHRIVGDVFVDVGRVWGRETIASTGIEAALDFVLGFLAPLRYRMGIAYLLRDPGKGDLQPYVALETSF